jgi:transcriptional antiterminator NusG
MTLNEPPQISSTGPADSLPAVPHDSTSEAKKTSIEGTIANEPTPQPKAVTEPSAPSPNEDHGMEAVPASKSPDLQVDSQPVTESESDEGMGEDSAAGIGSALEVGESAPSEKPPLTGAADVGDGLPAAEEVRPGATTPQEGAVKVDGGEAANKHWYVVKVQAGREESIKEAIERRVRIEGLEELFGQILIPVEKVAEMRQGRRVVRKKKLFPGYLMVQVKFDDRILYLFRETSGVGDFVGGSTDRPPQPMSEREVERMLRGQGEETAPTQAKIKPKFDKGDRVKVRDGTFAGMEGEVKELLEAKSQVKVELTIFGRPVMVEFEYWQVEPV